MIAWLPIWPKRDYREAPRHVSHAATLDAIDTTRGLEARLARIEAARKMKRALDAEVRALENPDARNDHDKS